MTEVRQQFSPTASQVWRLFDDKSAMAAGFVELQHAAGPLGGNRELVSLFESSAIKNDKNGEGSVFFTDNNG